MKKELFLENVKKCYPEWVNGEELKMYENNELKYVKYSSQYQERFMYSIATGRHHEVQKNDGMITEEHIDISLLTNFTDSKKHIDISFKDLNNKHVCLVENAILESTSEDSLERKKKEKFSQVSNYLIILMLMNENDYISEQGVLVQVNVYNPNVFFKNNNQYESYVSSHKECTAEEMYEKTGIFQQVWKFTKKDCNNLLKKFPSGFSSNQLNSNDFLLGLYENNVSESTNFACLNLENVEKIDIEGDYQFILKPKKIIENKYLLERIPFRSVQRGNSAYDNTREINQEKVIEYKNKIGKTFFELLKGNDFVNDDSALAQEVSKPGWNDREIGGTFNETIISVNKNSNKFRMYSTDMSLSNSQHNSYSLIEVKKDLDKANDYKEVIDLLDSFGVEELDKITEEQIRIYKILIEKVNPNISVNLFINKSNGKEQAKNNNDISSQSTYDQAKYAEKIKLQTLATALNIEVDDYHCYASTDISQDPKQRVTSTLKTFDIGELPLINTAYKRGEEVLKTNKNDLEKNVRDLKQSENFIVEKEGEKVVKYAYTDEEFKEYVLLRRLFKTADKNTENISGINDLFNENTDTLTKKKSKSQQEKLIAFLESNMFNMNKKNINETIKIIKNFPQNTPKDLKENIDEINSFFTMFLKYPQGKHKIDNETIEVFIKKTTETAIKVNTDRLKEMIKIIKYVKDFNKNNKTIFKKLFTSDEIVVRLVCAILGYKKVELSFDNFKKSHLQLVNNINNSGRDNWLPVQLRNNQYMFLGEEHIYILKELFQGMEITNEI